MFETLLKIRETSKHAFLATGSESALTVHSVGPQSVCRSVAQDVSLQTHTLTDLSSAQTMEDLSSRFGSGPILYDPTRVVSRLRGVVRLAAAFRKAADHDVGAIAYESRTRTLYVVLAEGIAARRTGEVMLKLALAARRWQTSGIDCHLSVRVCNKVPAAALLVPVDRASVDRPLKHRLISKWRQLVVAMGISALFASPAVAQGVNHANITTATGVTVGSGAKGDLGVQFAAPITGALGAQVDVGLGADGYAGAGGQLFVRDPDLGLLGLTAAVEALDEKVLYRLGAKSEFYLKALTAGVSAGWQSLDDKEGAFGSLDLSYYATPDFALRGSADLSPDLQLYRVGAEWRPGFDALPGLSLFSDFEHGSDGANAAKIGLAYHFGEDGVSLMERDRNAKTGSNIFHRQQLNYVS